PISSFKLDINEYPTGKENLQLMMRELQDKPFELTATPPEKIAPKREKIEPEQPAVELGKQDLDAIKDNDARHIREEGLGRKASSEAVSGFREELQSIVEQMQRRKAAAMKRTDTPSP